MMFSKGNCRLMFFSGAALILIGLGIIMMGQNVAGAVVMCIGVFPAVIGFMGLRMNLMIDMRSPKKNRNVQPPKE